MPEKSDFVRAPAVKSLSARKRFLFATACFVSPFLVLAIAEAALRLAGFGGNPPVIREVAPTERGTLVITDPEGAASYFFANPERPGRNEQYHFYVPKPSGTFRIVLAGESAMKGFPQPRHLAASSFLREMLQDLWPDRTVEVINLGTTAVANFPVLEIMTEALDYEPDLVIVSTGHNEFFGTYDVASIGRTRGRPWMLKAHRVLRSSALVQAAGRIAPGRGGGPQHERTLMELMLGANYIGAEDRRRGAAARNLERNLGAMIQRCRERGVPILICTQPSNERDLAPIGSETIDHLDPSGRTEFQTLLAAGKALARHSPSGAAAQFQAALAIVPSHARTHFYLGEALFAAGRHDEAANHFIRARDLDPMPWRATSMAREAILRAAEIHGARVCDVEQVFRAASSGGAIGWELMDDHVHPSLRGQALWAEAIVETLRENSLAGAQTRDATGLPDWQAYSRRLGANPYDAYGVAHTMRVIFNIPFMRQNNPEAFERFNRIAAEMQQEWTPQIVDAVTRWQTARPHAGGKRPITAMVARILMREGRFAEALELLRIAQRAVPAYTSWHIEYVYFALACREKLHGALSNDDRAEALNEIRRGEFLLRHGHSESGMTERYVGRLHQLRGEFAEAIPYLLASRPKLSGFDLVAADQSLILSYVKTGQTEKARELAIRGVAHSGEYSGLYEQMLAGIPQSSVNQ